jgi:hypothetical protein
MTFRAVYLAATAAVLLFLLAGCPDVPPALDDDQYEPNESNATAWFLGEVRASDPPASWNAAISTSTDRDYFAVLADDENSIGVIGDIEQFALNVHLVSPEGIDLDLYLYDESGTPIDSSTGPAGAGETVDAAWSGTVGLEDSRTWVIEVRGAGGSWGGGEYTLTIDLAESLE